MTATGLAVFRVAYAGPKSSNRPVTLASVAKPYAAKFAISDSAAKTKTLGQLATPDTKNSNGVLSSRLIA
jgi:hypothetical protein